MSLALRHHYRQLLQRERGDLPAPATSPLRFVLCYPNRYHVGMSCLGLHSVYWVLNQQCGLRPERAFLPDPPQLADFNAEGTPLFSLETQQDLSSCHLIGFSLQFEEDYANVVTMLRLAGVPLRAAEREETDPLVVAGGPCAAYNPLPLADLVDVFVVGDAEPVLPALIRSVEQCTSRGGVLSRSAALAALAQVPGLFVPASHLVPSANSTPHEVWNWLASTRRVAESLEEAPAHSVLFTPDTEFGDMHLIEVARGCAARCKFCVTGHALGPLRTLPPHKVVELARRGAGYTKRVGLVGPSVSAAPGLTDACRQLADEGFSFSLASMRIDSLPDELLVQIVRGGQTTLTVAPEAGTERLRRAVSKPVSDERLVDCLTRARRAGIEGARLYFVLGLPGETDADVEAIAALARRLREATRLRQLDLSVSVFVPKPRTPLAEAPMQAREVTERRAKWLQHALRREKGIALKIDSTRWAFVQAVLAGGGPELGETLIAAEGDGGTLGGWRRALSARGIDLFEEPTSRGRAATNCCVPVS